MRHDEPATMMHWIKPLMLLIGVLVLLLIADLAYGDSVRIYDVAGSDGPDILLSQVAELDGEYAEQFGEVVVGALPEGESKIDVEAAAILSAIRDQGAKLGLLDLSGFGQCTVHRTFTSQDRAEQDDSEPAVANIDARLDGSVTVNRPTTVRSMIRRAVAESMGVGEDRLKITFDRRDEELLNDSAVAGRYEVEPVAEPTLGAVSYRVTAYRGTEKAGQARTVSAQVQQRVIAVVASERIGRGELITRRQVRLREVLIDHVGERYVQDTALVTGQVAAQTLDAGEVISSASVKMPIAVKRRERVSVELNKGGIRITFNGMALDNGAVDQVIEVENLQTRERFMATVTARGKVVAGDIGKDKQKQAEQQDDKTQTQKEGER